MLSLIFDWQLKNEAYCCGIVSIITNPCFFFNCLSSYISRISLFFSFLLCVFVFLFCFIPCCVFPYKRQTLDQGSPVAEQPSHSEFIICDRQKLQKLYTVKISKIVFFTGIPEESLLVVDICNPGYFLKKKPKRGLI